MAPHLDEGDRPTQKEHQEGWMSSADTRPGDAADLPDYAPIPNSALGPALNEQDYQVERVERIYAVTHLIYSHHQAEHGGAASLFGRDVVRLGHEETRALLLRRNDPARPAPEETFQDKRRLEIGGERIDHAEHFSDLSGAITRTGSFAGDLIEEPSAELNTMLAGGPIRLFTPYLAR